MTLRILVVEDQQDLREIARFALEGAGYEVIEAATGPEGIAKAETKHPDLVLMDIQLPVLDGYESTRRIKALPRNDAYARHRGQLVRHERGRGKGASGRLRCLMTKPYSPKQLVDLVREFLAKV
jgi:two-component system cell cycle response regulator DivK